MWKFICGVNILNKLCLDLAGRVCWLAVMPVTERGHAACACVLPGSGFPSCHSFPARCGVAVKPGGTIDSASKKWTQPAKTGQENKIHSAALAESSWKLPALPLLRQAPVNRYIIRSKLHSRGSRFFFWSSGLGPHGWQRKLFLDSRSVWLSRLRQKAGSSQQQKQNLCSLFFHPTQPLSSQELASTPHGLLQSPGSQFSLEPPGLVPAWNPLFQKTTPPPTPHERPEYERLSPASAAVSQQRRVGLPTNICISLIKQVRLRSVAKKGECWRTKGFPKTVLLE